MSFVLSFLAVLLPLTLSPGPATVALAGQGMAGGIFRSLPFYFGLLISTAIVTLICGLGFSELILTNKTLFLVMQYASIAYLFYLGTKLVRARPSVGSFTQQYSFMNGLALSFLNPKLFVMMVALFSQFVDTPGDIKYVSGLFLVVIAFSQAVWLMLGVFMNSVIRSDRTLNHTTTAFGILMFGMCIYLLVKV
jgi:threonine/homoserine/homoserine lactone efflux protein